MILKNAFKWVLVALTRDSQSMIVRGSRAHAYQKSFSAFDPEVGVVQYQVVVMITCSILIIGQISWSPSSLDHKTCSKTCIFWQDFPQVPPPFATNML